LNAKLEPSQCLEDSTELGDAREENLENSELSMTNTNDTRETSEDTNSEASSAKQNEIEEPMNSKISPTEEIIYTDVKHEIETVSVVLHTEDHEIDSPPEESPTLKGAGLVLEQEDDSTLEPNPEQEGSEKEVLVLEEGEPEEESPNIDEDSPILHPNPEEGASILEEERGLPAEMVDSDKEEESHSLKEQTGSMEENFTKLPETLEDFLELEEHKRLEANREDNPEEDSPVESPPPPTFNPIWGL
jgi:hypothetical protein